MGLLIFLVKTIIYIHIFNVFRCNCNTIGGSIESLTSCSKFHFEEHVLEKLIRIEHKMEQNKKKMLKWEQNISKALKHVKDEDAKRTKQMELIQAEFKTELDHQKNLLSQNAENLIEGYRNTSDVMMLQNEVFVKDLNERLKMKEITRAKSEIKRNRTFQSLVEQTRSNLENQQQSSVDTQKDLVANYTILSQNMMKQQELFISDIQVNLEANFTLYVQKLKDQESQLTSDIQHVQMELEANKLMGHKQINKSTVYSYIHEWSKRRVAVSSYAVGGTYSSGSIVPFKKIETIQGLSNPGKETIRQTGKFVCESQGVYLISVFILTKTHGTFANLYKNNQRIAIVAFALNGHYQTSTLVILEHLAVNDTVYVKSEGNLFVFVYGSDHSCMSILQIS